MQNVTSLKIQSDRGIGLLVNPQKDKDQVPGLSSLDALRLAKKTATFVFAAGVATLTLTTVYFALTEGKVTSDYLSALNDLASLF